MSVMHTWPNASLMRIGLLPAAALLDFMVGDPWGWPHPVQAMGKVISRYSQWALRRDRAARKMKLAGVGLAFLVIGGSGGMSWLGLQTLGVLSPWLQIGGEVVLLASCFAGRSLRQAAEDVLTPLAAGDLSKARQQLALYVGRDTHQLSEEDIRRAILETVSENATDGVFAPLCFAILGAFFNLAAPIAVAYKAASTLDSMVGYRREPYTHLGWFSARLEDGLTWLPCRLSVALVALYSGKPGHVLRLCWRDARADPSPNAGWSECAYAASLGVQLGGENTYQGQRTVKPLLGEANRPITAERIRAALALTRRVFLTLLFLGCVGGLAALLANP